MTADQVSYGEFVNSMPTPSLINIVTMEPLEGNAVLEINLPIAFSIIDRLVGGPGTQRPKARELTEIELALSPTSSRRCCAPSPRRGRPSCRSASAAWAPR